MSHRIGLAMALVACAVLSAPALAGEVRVDVANFAFTPRAVNCNLGDHVVWIWRGGSHSVTSGDSSTITPDGTFDSGVQTTNASLGTAFSWRSDRSGAVLYFCQPHAPGMAGRVIVGTAINVADFRFTEVQFNVPGEQDLVEIANVGPAVGDLGRYRLVVGGTVFTIPRDTLSVGTQGRVVVHLNTSGTSTQTDLFTTAIAGLPEPGSVALYTPNTAPGHTALTDATQLVDYVEWGAGGQANEATAVAAGLWVTGQSIDNVATGHSIELCSTTPRGLGAWAEIAVPNFGSYGSCTTPARRTTWGEVKQIYK